MDLQSLKIERNENRRRRRGGSPWPLRIAILLVLGAAVWIAWPALSGFADRVRLPAVRTMVVRAPSRAAAAAATGTAANGYVVARRRAALSSDVPGRIVEMLVEEGTRVERGQVVARLFAEEYGAALERAKADVGASAAAVIRAQTAHAAAAADEALAAENVANAEALLAEAKAQLQWQQLEFARVDDLVQRGISSPRDLDRTRSEVDAAEARVHAMEASLRAARAAATTANVRVQVAHSDIGVALAQQQVAAANEHLAQATFDKAEVRAPFAGVIVLKDAEVGEVVSPNVQGGSTARGAVCTLVDFATLEVQANVPETSLSAVTVGAPAEVFLDAFPDQRLRGAVDRVWPTADRQKATVEVRVRLLDKPGHLRPEMGVRIVFLRETAAAAPSPEAAADAGPQALLVPDAAVVEAGGRTFVFVLERDVVRAQDVAVGERRSGRIAIASGLREGQRIVLEPPPSLQDGDRVRIVDA